MPTMNISVPKPMARRINSLARTKGYASRSEFVRDLLREQLEEFSFAPFERRPLPEIKHELAKTGRYRPQFIESVIKGLKKSSPYANR